MLLRASGIRNTSIIQTQGVCALHEFSSITPVKRIKIDALIREDEQNIGCDDEDSYDDIGNSSSDDEEQHEDDEDDDTVAMPTESRHQFVIDEQLDHMDTDTNAVQVHSAADCN